MLTTSTIDPVCDSHKNVISPDGLWVETDYRNNESNEIYTLRLLRSSEFTSEQHLQVKVYGWLYLNGFLEGALEVMAKMQQELCDVDFVFYPYESMYSSRVAYIGWRALTDADYVSGELMTQEFSFDADYHNVKLGQDMPTKLIESHKHPSVIIRKNTQLGILEQKYSIDIPLPVDEDNSLEGVFQHLLEHKLMFLEKELFISAHYTYFKSFYWDTTYTTPKPSF